MRESAVIEVGGERVELMPERAVWWPGARTLVVADLHLGKEHAFAAVGIGLPGTVLEEALGRLTRCIELAGATRVVIAGDLLHARLGTTPEVIERVAAWRRTTTVELVLVPGNHDGAAGEVVGAWDIEQHGADLRDGPFRFVHEPDAGVADAFTWAGHLHPAARLSGGRDTLRLPCFCIGARVGVLPAFTLFSGRTTPAMGIGDRAWAIAEGRVFEAPARVGSGG